MAKYLFILLGLLIINNPISYGYNSIKEFQEDVDAAFEFYTSFSDRDIPLKIVVVDKIEVPPRAMGLCYNMSEEPIKDRLIEISFALVSDDVRENLITLYHEIGHCGFRLLHDSRLRDDFCPLTFMYPGTIGKDCLDNHFKEYESQFRYMLYKMPIATDPI